MQTDNKNTLLNLIRLYGPVSRTKLADYISISIPAISNHVTELLEAGIIKEVGSKQSNGGRKAVLLDMNKEYGYTICIDFGQDIFRIAAININNEILEKRILPSKELGDKNTGLIKIQSMIEEINQKISIHATLLGIGIGISGIINYQNNKLVIMPNLKEWENVDLVATFHDLFKVPVFIDDSARMMALWESVLPGNGRYQDLVFVSVGAGIGTGIIVSGKLLRGVNGGAGELGHIIVEEGGLPCGCGNRGCLEQYASVTSMVNRAKNAIKDGVMSSILTYANNDINQIDSFCLEKALKDQDKLAYTIIIEAGNYLGIGLSKIVNLLNPEYIILGGGGMNISSIIFDELIRSANLRAMSTSMKHTKILVSSKEESGLLGTSIHVLDNIFKFNSCMHAASGNILSF